MNRIFLTSLALLVCTHDVGAETAHPFEGEDWRLEGEARLAQPAGGHIPLQIGNGSAFLDDAAFRDGSIEFDIFVTGDRAFVYLMFRGQSREEYEDLYLRPHKSGLPDAVQYAPVFQRRSAWQIYHGDRGTAAAPIPANAWTRVRLELIGRTAKVWIGDNDQPAMSVDELGHEPAAGWLAVRGFVPQGSTAEYAAMFRDFRVKHAERAPPSRNDSSVPTGQLVGWRVSPAFDAPAGPLLEVPDEIVQAQWTNVPAQSNGWFEFLRSREVPEGSRHWAVVAETILNAEDATTCTLHLGYSDEITLLLGGRPIAYQDSSYRFGSPRQDGVMHDDQLVVFLPLRAGENRLRAVVADRFGGWGLSGRLGACPGVRER